MKTKLLIIGASGLLTVGAICHLTGKCPLKAMKQFHSTEQVDKK